MDIKELRSSQGLSQSEIAKKLEVTPGTIGHLENGRMKVSDKLAAKVKEVFGVELTAKETKPAVKAGKKLAAKKVSAKAKAAAKEVEDKVVADKIEVKKTAAKATRKAKETVKKIEKATKVPTQKAKTAKLEIIIQSPMGGNITPEEIAAKLPKGVETVFVCIDQNKLWWIKDEETGSVDIW